MMDLAAHNVSRIIIEPEFTFTHGDNENVSRGIVIEFEDGTTQTIECYSAKDKLTLEVQ